MSESEPQFSPNQTLDPLAVIPSTHLVFLDLQPEGEALDEVSSNDALFLSPTLETRAQARRRERIALIEEFGGPAADLKRVAVEAIRRGMYSPRTNLGDIEAALLRTWRRRNRRARRQD